MELDRIPAEPKPSDFTACRLGVKRSGMTAKEKLLAFAAENLAKGNTDAHIAELAGWSKSFLSNLRSNPDAQVSAAKALQFAQICDVPPEYILDPNTPWPYAPHIEKGVNLTKYEITLLDLAHLISGDDPTLKVAMLRLANADTPRPATHVQPRGPVSQQEEEMSRAKKGQR